MMHPNVMSDFFYFNGDGTNNVWLISIENDYQGLWNEWWCVHLKNLSPIICWLLVNVSKRAFIVLNRNWEGKVFFSLFSVSANYLTNIGPVTGYHAHECRSWANLSTTTVERVEMPVTDAYNRASITSWSVLVVYLLFYIICWCEYFHY